MARASAPPPRSGASPVAPPPPLLLLLLLLRLLPLAGALSDRDTLLRMYQFTSGRHWNVNDGWSNGADGDGAVPVCSWHGIQCEGGGPSDDAGVTHIVLPGNGLSGRLPKILWSMPKLRYVLLRGNNILDAGFEGFVSNSSPSPVVQVQVSENALETVKGIGSAPPSLEELHMSSNRLEGKFPEEVLKLRKLKLLIATYNPGIKGTIPTTIGNMSNLRTLMLWYNSLSGTIPTEFGSLNKLETLGLDNNGLTGAIPHELNKMANLKYFSCQNSNPEGSGVGLTGPLPSLSDLVYLQDLYLDSNSLTAVIPEDFLKHSNVTDKVVTVGLRNNSITGTLPLSLKRFDKLHIDVTGNEITGLDKSLCKNKKWMAGQVELYGCDAILCPRGTYQEVGRQASDDSACEPCDNGAVGAPFFGATECLAGDASVVDGGVDDGVSGSSSAVGSWEEDQQILVEFGLALGWEKWSDPAGWNVSLANIDSPDDTRGMDLKHCSFRGVTCDGPDTRRVAGLSLPRSGLKGRIPRSLSGLTELTALDLSYNDVRFDSAWDFGRIGDAPKLSYLTMDQTDIQKWDGIGRAKGLTHLSINDVYFDGTVSDEIFGLEHLQVLRCQFSGLTGPLPTRMGELTKMERLNFYGNRLNGTIPTELGLLSRIHILELSENDFSGPIPTELNGLQKLTRLSVHQSSRDGEGLSGPLPPFDDLPDLVSIRFDSNAITGSISPDFLRGTAASDPQRHVMIGLSYNRLTGTVPKELAAFKNASIDVVGNEIDGVAQELCSMSDWNNGEVGKVGSCDAILCPKGEYNVYGMAVTQFGTPCAPCFSAGSMGSTFCDNTVEFPQRLFLDRMYRETGGPNWSREGNGWTDTGLPACSYAGVMCDDEAANMGVKELDLTNFGMSGLVPPDIWLELPELETLSLGNNPVDLSFDGIGNATKLKSLDLTGTAIKSVRGIEGGAPSLEELYMAGVQVAGPFPPELLGLTKLRVLELDHNHITGTVPADMVKLGGLEEFGCEGCELKGTVPSELGDLANLVGLDLANNLLSGFIPTELGRLQNLQWLDLSRQRMMLTGPVFAFDTNPALAHVDLSHNILTGTVPDNLGAQATKGTDTRVQFILSSNDLTGSVPTALDVFANLDLYLDDNMITELSETLCDEDNHGWMLGMVGVRESCDAIMCPRGTYSETGRADGAGAESDCKPCERPSDAPYFGQTHCGGSERSKLMQIYDALGGDSWAKSRGWMTDKPICRWHGVKCADDSPIREAGVEEINLEDNNLKPVDGGDFDSDLFWGLPYLKVLDLKGNDVQLKFDNVQAAFSLEKLILSATELKSVDGIEKASGLKELHITDNALTGSLEESGILQLTKLEHLYISYNNFSGDVSSVVSLTNLKELFAFQNQLGDSLTSGFGGLTNLQQLVVGENFITGTIPKMPPSLTHFSLYNQRSIEKITGTLPDFAGVTGLLTLDLADNKLEGSIPDNFLPDATNTDKRVQILLDNNDLTGVVPATLERFSQLDLGIVGNKITSFAFACEGHDEWMDSMMGTVGSCAAIACPPFTFREEMGRQTLGDGVCNDCPEQNNNYVGNTQCTKTNHEREILMEIYDSTMGTFWKKQNGWGDVGIPICSWDGVNCGDGNDDQDEGVVRLNLQNHQLDGDVPTSIYKLPMLKEVNLRYNYDAIMSFEGIKHAANLEVLILSEIIIKSLEGIGKAPNLRRLHLTGCDLWGELPSELFDLAPTLKGLYIAYNRFTGPLPTEFGLMEHLTDLYAFDNDLMGQIPTEFGKMKSLKNLVLSENRLAGQLPEELSAMPNLQLLSIYRREKEGLSLDGVLPSFGNVPQLTDLYLDHNTIGGAIPPLFLSSSNNIELVNLAHNKISGTVPVELMELPPFQLELEGNQVVDLPDDFCFYSDMMQGNVRSFGCDAILCKPGTASIYGRQNSTDSECVPCADISEAQFWGSTRCGEELSEKAILSKLYDSCGGADWYNTDGWKSDDVSVCKWHGISCDEDGNVHAIRLGSNNLVGTPPPEIFDLPHLRWLWFHSNPIRFSFSNIGRASELVELRLDSTTLSSLQGIGAATSLEILDARFNRLTDTFPSDEIFKLAQLESLSLANNELRGQLPDFSALKELKTLRLGTNRFSGTLPSFSLSAELRALDLSQNKIGSSIPPSFLEDVSTDRHLEINLASNELTGTVPVDLDRFRELTLYLRDNKFTDLPEKLCDKDNADWNTGGVGRFKCDAILCPPGTYNSMGRQRDSETKCESCDKSKYYGQVTCGAKPSAVSSGWALVNGRERWLTQTAIIGFIFAWLTL